MKVRTYDIINAGPKNRFMCSGKIVSNSGRGIQFHNFPRGELKATPEMFDAIGTGDWEKVMPHGDPMTVLASCARGMIKAPAGYKFLVSDFSNIEGRVLAWVAGETWKIKAFADFDKGIGPDLYKLTYARSFNKNVEDVTSDERQLGKVQELALGYAGGVGAFHNMAAAYGVVVSDKLAADLRDKWRAKHPNIVSFWEQCENAAKKAIITKEVQEVNEHISFDIKGKFLRCRLPSGRYLHYYKPKIEEATTAWGSMRMQITFQASKGAGVLFTESTYGGKLVENLVQGIARDVLAEALIRLDKKKFNVIGHCHDEVISIVKDIPIFDINTYDNILEENPKWATDLPTAAEGWEGYRYRK